MIGAESSFSISPGQGHRADPSCPRPWLKDTKEAGSEQLPGVENVGHRIVKPTTGATKARVYEEGLLEEGISPSCL